MFEYKIEGVLTFICFDQQHISDKINMSDNKIKKSRIQLK